MAPMTFTQQQDGTNLHIFEDYLLRCIILFFTRAARASSQKDYELRFNIVHRRIVQSKTSKRRYKYLSKLTQLILCFLEDTGLNISQKSISRLAGLQEFCQFLEIHPWLKEQWRGIVVACTVQCWGTWVAKGPTRPDFTMLQVATEQWEWSCFRHYRDCFILSAIVQNPCNTCASRLHQMTRLVEYDKVELAFRYYNPAARFLTCVRNPLMQGEVHIASLEPFIMILRQIKNARWLAWWERLIRMQTGLTVAEIYQTCRQSSREYHDGEGRTTLPQRIGDMMYEYRDLPRLILNLQVERGGVDASIALWQRERDRRGHIIEDVASPVALAENRP